MLLRSVISRTISMQPSKSVSIASVMAPLRDRLDKLLGGNLVSRQEDDRRDTRGGAVRRQSGRCVACRGAGHCRDILPLVPHLFDHAHQHGHAEILEGTGVAVPALFDP